MKIACPVSYLSGDTFDEKFAFLARMGFDAVELSTADAEGQEDATLVALRRQDVVVGALWGLVNGCTSPDPAKRKEAIKDLQSAFQFAAECGTRKVVFIDHCLPQGKSDATETRKVLLESIASAVEHAERLGVELAVEPLSPRDHALIASTDDGIRLCQEIKSPALLLNLDTYHMSVAGEDPATSIEKGWEYMAHIHYSDYEPPQDDPRRPFPGEGEVDFKACTATIARHRYSGLICIEGSVGQRETLEERLRQTVKYLKAVAEEVGG